MSSRAELYGIVSGPAGMSTGLNGEQVQTYWVDTSFGGERWIGFSVKDEPLVAGEVVTIIECGEDGDPWAAWGLVKYHYGLPMVYSVKHFATRRLFDENQKYRATSALNWLCRAAGAVGRIFWPGRVISISGSTLTVQSRWAEYSRAVPVSSDLAAAEFSVGDYVLVYSTTAGEEVVGWWMMEPGLYSEYNRYTAVFTGVWQNDFPGGKLTYTFSLGKSCLFAEPNTNWTFPAGWHQTAAITFNYEDPIPAGSQIGITLAIPVPVGGWKADMWPMTVSAPGYYSSSNTLDPSMFYNE